MGSSVSEERKYGDHTIILTSSERNDRWIWPLPAAAFNSLARALSKSRIQHYRHHHRHNNHGAGHTYVR